MIQRDIISWKMPTEAELQIATNFKYRIAEIVGEELASSTNEQNVWRADHILTVEDRLPHQDACVEAVGRLMHDF